MGYLYSNSGGLLCDLCAGPGAVKVRCPFGWCQPFAACKDCKVNHAAEFQAAKHQPCKAASTRMKAQDAAKDAARKAGEFTLVAGMGKPEGMVQAVFRGANDVELGRMIPAAIYEQREPNMSLTAFEALAGTTFQPAPIRFY